MSHTCHAVACAVAVPPKMFMCLRHWRMVPRKQQITVWNVYRPGQETDKQPSAEYLAVTKLVRADLARVEHERCCKDLGPPAESCSQCMERLAFMRSAVAEFDDPRRKS